MTHDFANKTKARAKQKPNQKKPSPGPDRKVPAWAWLVTGFVAGIFVSFLTFLGRVTPETAPQVVAKKNVPVDTKTETQFDFYTLLPEREMIVPAEKDREPTTPKQAVTFFLQAGSFRNLKDADRLRAQLILMGYTTKIEAGSAKNGDVWHRVQIGPFTSRSAVAKARSTLLTNGIEALLLRRKAKA